MEENDQAEVPVDEIWQSYVSGSQMSNKMKYDVSYFFFIHTLKFDSIKACIH